MDIFYIVRTSWLFGKNGKNIVETKAVDDQIGIPTYTVDVAKAIISLTDNKFGVYHITNSGQCSWFEFAKEISGNSRKSDCVVLPCKSEIWCCGC
jgi:dTDP-4-dehydrorhamnose reductase